MRQVLRIATLLVFVPVLAVLPTGTAFADDQPADLAVSSQPGHGTVGDFGSVLVILHNYGPGIVATGESDYELTAPGGTVFDPALERGITGPNCIILVPHQRVRCHASVRIYPDNNNPSGVTGWAEFSLRFTIVSKCVTPGRYAVTYARDPITSNNATALQVSVDGAGTRPCPNPTPTRRPTSTAQPAAPTTPLATSAAPVPSETPTPGADGPSESTAAEQVALERTGTGTGTIIAIGGGVAMLVLLGAGATVILRRRRLT